VAKPKGYLPINEKPPMTLTERIDAFAKLGDMVNQGGEALDEAILLAYYQNRWFTTDNSYHMVKAVGQNYLNKEKLMHWLAPYQDRIEQHQPKTVGLTLAGNVPLVGFHDVLSVLITGNKAQVKLSSKDTALIMFLINNLFAIEPRFKEQVEVVEMLKGFGGVIATGGNNTSRYFEYYFGKYPNIIRKNRSSVAVLTGKEINAELALLGNDIFQYYGLGCRNVSKIYVPMDYEFRPLFEALEPFAKTMDQDKYKNNYDYNRTLLLMNNTQHLSNDFIMLREHEDIASPVSTLHYQYFKNLEEVALDISLKRAQIQCVVGRAEVGAKMIPFGQAQQPELWDYADDVNTIEWLIQL
jgi:hypothetical protein